VEGSALFASADYANFDDFWEPFTFGVGPAGQYLASLPAVQRAIVKSIAYKRALATGLDERARPTSCGR
jgi:hypothetical protein